MFGLEFFDQERFVLCNFRGRKLLKHGVASSFEPDDVVWLGRSGFRASSSFRGMTTLPHKFANPILE